MKIATAIAALALVSAPSLVMAAPGSCERVKSDMNNVSSITACRRIIYAHYRPNDQADQPDSQVVGHCANDTHKILYTRTSSGNAPANTSPAQDGSSAEPQ